MDSKKSINGIVNVNKPAGMTSRQVVDRVKHIYGVKKAGHGGTLDPDATGVLLICLGRGTKLFDLLQVGSKEYIATLTLGVITDTMDTSGKVLETSKVGEISCEKVYQVFSKFIGEVEQKVPMYSAIKYEGKPLYKYARKGIEIKDRPSRIVRIYALEILDINSPGIKFRVECSKGTYIRVLVEDIGNEMGYGACLSSLVRTRAGIFSIESSVSLEELEENPEKAMQVIHSVEEVKKQIEQRFGE